MEAKAPPLEKGLPELLRQAQMGKKFGPMTAIAKDLDQHLQLWPEATRFHVEEMVADAIRWGDAQAADLAHGRDLEQDVLDILDAP